MILKETGLYGLRLSGVKSCGMCGVWGGLWGRGGE